jgi:hypothetical protein
MKADRKRRILVSGSEEVERLRRVRDDLSSQFATLDEYFAWLRKLDREYRQRKKRAAARRKARLAKGNGR